jgi:hypothetical protein
MLVLQQEHRTDGVSIVPKTPAPPPLSADRQETQTLTGPA